jgi:hypothetical protein
MADLCLTQRFQPIPHSRRSCLSLLVQRCAHSPSPSIPSRICHRSGPPKRRDSSYCNSLAHHRVASGGTASIDRFSQLFELSFGTKFVGKYFSIAFTVFCACVNNIQARVVARRGLLGCSATLKNRPRERNGKHKVISWLRFLLVRGLEEERIRKS